MEEVLEGSDEGGYGFEREIGDSVRAWRGLRVTGREREKSKRRRKDCEEENWRS